MKFARAFETLNGRPPGMDDIRRFQTLTSALETTPDDAILSIFVALDHYEIMYEKVPAQIIEALRLAIEVADGAAEKIVNDASKKVQTIVAKNLVPLAEAAFEKGVGKYIDQIDSEAGQFATARARPMAAVLIAAVVVVSVVVGWAGGLWSRASDDAQLIAAAAVAQKTVAGQLAQRDAEAAAVVANLKAEQATAIANLSAAKGWAGTAEGQLAYRFFTIGDGVKAARCNGIRWDVGESSDKKKLCVPQHSTWGGWEKGHEGWVIP